MPDITGEVEQTSYKDGTGKRGKWFKHGVKVDGVWYNGAFNADLGANEGDIVKIRFNTDEYGNQIDQFRVEQKAANGSAKGNGKGTSGGGSNKDFSIAAQNAGSTAAELFKMFVELDAVPVNKTNTKAAKAARYDECTMIFDKIRAHVLQDSMDPAALLERVKSYETQDNAPPATQELPDGELPEEVSEDDDF